MGKDQLFGAVILVASVVGIVVYGWLLYIFPTTVLQITAFIAVGLVLGIAAWIGWVMATTAPPAPLESSFEHPPAAGSVTNAAPKVGTGTRETSREA
jgi:predicted DNA-binding transcriptional regulator